MVVVRPVKFCKHCNTQILYMEGTRRWVHAFGRKPYCRPGCASEAEPK